jgi:hypothetical protein
MALTKISQNNEVKNIVRRKEEKNLIGKLCTKNK